MLAAIILITLASLLLFLYKYRKNQINVLNKFKVIGPKPNVIFGNLSQLNDQQLFECRRRWTQQYGKVYGYYEGPTPVIVISDLDILREVFVKQFHNFNNRPIFPLQEDPKNDKVSHMFFARDDRWKRLRSLSNPIFSPHQIKKSYTQLQRLEENFVDQLNASGGKVFNIYEDLQKLSFDVICEIIFGIEVNNSDKSRDTCRQIFTQSTYNAPKTAILTIFIPELHNFFRWLFNVTTKLFNGDDPISSLLQQVGNIIESRKSQHELRRDDFLQAMLNAQKDNSTMSSTAQSRSSCTLINQSSTESSSRSSTSSCCDNSHWDDAFLEGCTKTMHVKVEKNNNLISTHPCLTFEEVKSQCYLLLMAGYETTSNILAFGAYSLAANQDVQQLLYQELHQVFQASDDNSHTNVVTFRGLQELKYMDCVVNEVLRMYPVVSPLLSRECSQHVEVMGHHFPAGAKVIPDIWSIHYDQDIWGPEDPHTFCPERFRAERHALRHPMSFLAFGAGPKCCLGMRFALLEVKSTLAHLLLRYRLLPGDESTSSNYSLPRFHEGCTISPRDGIYVRLEER